MVVYSFGSCNVMRSIESLNSSEEVSTSSITGSPTGYWNLFAAPDRLPKLFSHPYRQDMHVANRNLQKIVNWNYCIEDTAYERDGASNTLQKEKATSDPMCIMEMKRVAKKLWV